MFGHSKSKPRYRSDKELARRVHDIVPERVNTALQDQPSSDCSDSCLCHDVTRKRVAKLVKGFSDGSTDRTNAVYVLECQWKTVSQKVVREELRLQNNVSWIDEAQSNKRLLYVGVSTAVPSRLWKHALGRGDGANFTQMFPPTRLLSIQWFNRESDAYRAEELTAEILREETHDGVYVSQPG
ncbi:GIY-YIG nuclease family protein [Halorubrum coriense]|uniref:GIY-YIG nuclease family protein n=1 Tax=Halorubrum coriense TaxID=64713 RepID=UPI001268128D|nr:GIY-YIG nuclease family protein [Halorubrum coriense]